MHEFLSTFLGWPSIVFSIALAVVVIYWCLAIMGLVDWGEGVDMDVDMDAPGEIGLIASYVVAFGLSGVPFSIVVTLLAIVGWLLSMLASIWLLPWVPTLPLHLAAGLGLLLACAFLSIVISARLVRPLRGIFVTRWGTSSASLVGQECRILTGVVDERQGRAEVAQRGASINIRVWAASPNTLQRGSSAIICEYDAAAHRYLVQAIDHENNILPPV